MTRLILELDYSQAELRTLAEVTKDANLIKAYTEDGADIHAMTAGTIYNLPLDRVQKKHRDDGKNVNFACCYEQTPWGYQDYIFKKTKQVFTIQQCEHHIESFFKTYPGVRQYHQWVHKDTLEKWNEGYVSWTLGGRPRYWGPRGIRIKRKANGEVYTICNDVINHPIQGTVADFVKLAMVWVDDALAGEDVFMDLQVHDSLRFDCPNDMSVVRDVAEEISKIMLRASETLIKVVPMEVEAKVGKSWGECIKLMSKNSWSGTEWKNI